MPVTHTTPPPSGDRNTLSVGDVRRFLASIDGCPDETPIKARIRFGGWIFRLDVSFDEEPPPEHPIRTAPEP